MACQPVGSSRFGINPIVQIVSVILASENFRKLLASATLKQHLFGLKRAEQLVDIFVIPFGSQKFAGGNIHKCDAGHFFIEMN